MRFTKRSVFCLLAAVAVLGCRPDVKTAEFAVLSDLHLYDNALGVSSPEFLAYEAEDRKLLAQSEEILDAAVADLKTTPLDFVLVSGDLTKDGELVNHQLVARKLWALERSQRDLHVYVVPGNHDIWNPHAVSYLTSPPTPVAQISPQDFKRIYAAFGYAEALDQDPASLSYVAEPRPGVWILAVDSAEYDQNHVLGSPVTAGRLAPATQAWILKRLQDAAHHHKTVIAMMHHGVIEHFLGESQLFAEYLLTDYPAAGKALADAGLRIVFTGHFHAQDVVAHDYGTSSLVDVETGSLVTPPSAYRVVHLDVPTRTFDISSRHVTSIPSHPDDFLVFSKTFLDTVLSGAVMAQLTNPPYGLDAGTAGALAPLVVGGLEANLAGDEVAPAPVAAQIQAMLGSGDPLTVQLGMFLYGFWTDLPPPDNEVSITVE